MNPNFEKIKHLIGDIKLNPPLSENEVTAFEREHNISLPLDYRAFLTQIGNGGDGPPEYGLLKLGEI